MAPPPILVRAMTADDLGAARSLLAQLGYAVEAPELARRFATVAATDGHAVLVAHAGAAVVGLLHVYARPAIEKPLEAIVQALVVDAMQRQRGIGGLLMDAAERWAAARGLPAVALSSNVVRAEAHAFYAGRGYTVVATGHLFRKYL